MQPETNVIPFPIIQRKPADRELVGCEAAKAPMDQWRTFCRYRCIHCGRTELWNRRANHEVYCEHDGAEMRPVEGK